MEDGWFKRMVGGGREKGMRVKKAVKSVARKLSEGMVLYGQSVGFA